MGVACTRSANVLFFPVFECFIIVQGIIGGFWSKLGYFCGCYPRLLGHFHRVRQQRHSIMHFFLIHMLFLRIVSMFQGDGPYFSYKLVLTIVLE